MYVVHRNAPRQLLCDPLALTPSFPPKATPKGSHKQASDLLKHH